MAALLLASILALTMLAATFGAAAAASESPVQQEPSPPPPSPTDGGQVRLPTATPTIPGGPTATPSATPTITPVMAEIIGDPTNLRTGPALDFEIVAELTPGVQLPIIGRWLGFDWYLVQYPDAPNGEAWVYAPLVIVQGDITTIPAVDPPSAPTLDPEAAAAAATAAVLVQTPGAVETATAVALNAQSGVTTVTPGAGGAVAPGVLPTFTPPPPLVQPEQLALPNATNEDPPAVPPAVIIVSMAAMGVLTLTLGVLRRLF